MRARLLRGYLALAVFVLVALGAPLAVTLANGEVDRLEAAVLADASVVAAAVEEALESGAPVAFGQETLDYVADSGSRIVVTDVRGVSVADTGAAVPRDFSTRPEVVAALAGQRASGQRLSETLGTELLYVAVPVVDAGGVLGAVRITYPTREVRERLLAQLTLLGGVAAAVLLASAGIAVALSRWAVQPLDTLGRAVDRMADGDLTARADVADGPPEVVALARRVDDMADRLGSLLEAQRGFASDVSHQLRTPLTGLRLELETLQDATADPAGREGLERAIEGTRRLSRLVEGLLTLARLEGQRPPLEDLEVASLVTDAVATWEALALEAEVALVTDVDPAVARTPARGIASHLSQIVDVAVDNALAIAPTGTTIEVAARVVDGRVEVHVTDEGPGMPAELRDRALQRGWQGTTPTGRTGLGLAIAARLADAARAELRLDDAPTGGLRVTVRLGG